MSVISQAQALSLYGSYLRQQIARMPAALRNNPVVVTTDPRTGQWVNLSFPQLLGEVQRRTAIGVNEAVKYAAQQGYQVVR